MQWSTLSGLVNSEVNKHVFRPFHGPSPGALSLRRLNQAAAAANLQQSEAGARWGGLESNSIPTEHDREVVCLGSEHEKDAERRREDAERASKNMWSRVSQNVEIISASVASVRKPKETLKGDSDSCLASLKKQQHG
jgi:hypothetical protein